jgi:hypothetical protein
MLMISLFKPKRILLLTASLFALNLCFGIAYAVAADGDHQSSDDGASGADASFILTQPQPYTRAHEYFTTPAAPMSTLSPNAFTSGMPYVFGNSYSGYNGGFPLAVVTPGGVPFGGWGGGYGGGWGSGYGGWGRPGGSGGPAGRSGNPGFGWGGYGTGYGAPGFGAPIIGAPIYGGFGGTPFAGGYGGFGSIGSGYGGNPFTNGGFGSGYWGGYGMSGFGGYGYGGFGGVGGMGLGGGNSLGLMQPSHVVQTEPSKASGNYYAPSTVDTTASGSYYAQTSGTAIQMPAKRPSTNANYWKQDSNSNYWGSGGGSSTPFGKDLNSVPWNK